MTSSRIQIRIHALGGTRHLEALGQFVSDKSALAQLLVRALSRSVSLAVRRRFLEAQYHMVGMEKETDPANQDEKAVLSAQIARLQRLRDAAFVEDRVETAKRLNRRIQALSGRNEKRLRVDQESSGPLSTGKYRPRIKKILKLLVAEPQVLLATSSKAVAGIAPLRQLDAIRTPSFTTEQGKDTSSSYTILWRQLEFGTGIYSTLGARGAWWYGPYAGAGLYLRGNRAGSFLRSATGVPYDEDAVRFAKEFEQALVRALGGE